MRHQPNYQAPEKVTAIMLRNAEFKYQDEARKTNSNNWFECWLEYLILRDIHRFGRKDIFKSNT